MRGRRPDPRAVVAVSAALALVSGCRGGDGEYLEQIETTPPPARPGLPAADVADELAAVTVSIRPAGRGPQSTGLFWRRNDTVVTVNPSLARNARVVLASGGRAVGGVVGRDPVTGIVVVHVPGRTPTPPPVAEQAPRPGTQAVALSEGADGIARSTVASVSALADRALRGIAVTVVELDQPVDAAGAPVMNRRGEVIGVNVTNAQRRALVLPAATVDRVVAALLAGRRPSHRALGSHVVPLTPSLRSEFGLSVDTGVLVRAVDAGSFAARAGVRPGDVIVGIAGREIRSVSDYLKAAGASTTVLDVVRGNRRLALTARLSKR
jgi:S1-C subfamily serine protease